MTVLDAFAVIALLRDEPAASQVRELLRDEQAVLTALGLAEVIDHLVRIVGVSDEEAVLDLAQLRLADARPVDADLALGAALLRTRHYHRTDRAVSLADCVAAETARGLDVALATADPHLLELCHEDGIPTVALPDSDGSMWRPSRD